MRTMNEAFDRYLKECVPLLGVRTQRDYARHITHLRIHFGNRDIVDVRPRDIGRYLDVESGQQQRNKTVSVLSSVFGKCMGKWYVDDLDSNPCRNVERHNAYPRTRYITDSEFSAVKAIAPTTIQLGMDLALLTGQRQGDLLDLTWHQVQSDHIRLTQGKTGKQLGIRITSAVAEVLLRCRQYRQFNGPRLYLIRGRTGDPYTHEGYRALWQRVMDDALRRQAIRSRFTFHDIRAKCATDKDDLKGASELLGHGQLQMTDRVYIRGLKFVDPLR